MNFFRRRILLRLKTLKLKKMKRIIFSLLLIIAAQCGFAQLTVTTNFRQDATWDDKKEQWNVSSTDEGATTLDFNKELTSFKHTTATITSRYEILEYKYDEEAVKYTMKVKSDVGNEYEMIIDGINNCVAFFFWRNNVYTLVRHTIKETHIRN
jgi:hypothetical protein